MNQCEKGIALYLGEERLRFIQNVVVGIAGVGGLGSNCAMHLVRSGFKRFVLVDFDEVDASNLNRQCFRMNQIGQSKVEAMAVNLRMVNPDIEIDALNVCLRLDDMLSVFARCDVVVEALDEPQFKKALVESFMSTKRLVVSASGICGVGAADSLVTRKMGENVYMIGDMTSECSMEKPPLSPMVGVAAAKQADVVLNHYLEMYAKEQGQ